MTALLGRGDGRVNNLRLHDSLIWKADQHPVPRFRVKPRGPGRGSELWGYETGRPRRETVGRGLEVRRSAAPLRGTLSLGNRNCVHAKACPRVFAAALFMRAEKRTQLRCPSTEQIKNE